MIKPLLLILTAPTLLSISITAQAIPITPTSSTIYAQAPAKNSNYGYPMLHEMADFPYLAQYLQKQILLSRDQVLAKAEEDRQARQQDPDNYKPLAAEVIETQLSHLLNWMTSGADKTVHAIVVYDKSGMLQGQSNEQAANLCKNIIDNKPLTWSNLQEIFPIAIDTPVFEKFQKTFPSTRNTQSYRAFMHTELGKKYPHLKLLSGGIYGTDNRLRGYILFLVEK